MKLNTIPYTFPLFYEGKKEVGTMYYNSGILEEETKFQYDSSREFIGLYFNLNNEIKYKVSGDSEHKIGENQFNMVYLPKAWSCELTFNKGKYASFIIEFPVPFLKLIVGNFPFLESFVDETKRMTPLAISEKHLTISSVIRDKINEVIYNNMQGEIIEDYLKLKFLDVVLLCFEHRQRDDFAGYIQAR